MEALDGGERPNSLAPRPKKIQGHANFFKAGIGLGRHLVCSVKTSALSTTIKVYEPMDNLSKGKKKPALSKMFQGGQDTLKPFKVSSYYTIENSNATANTLLSLGILYSRRVLVYPLPKIDIMCWLCSRI